MNVACTCRELKEQGQGSADEDSVLETEHCAADVDSCGAMSSSDEQSPLQLQNCTAVTLPSASLLMSELLMHQRQEQQPQSDSTQTDSADTDALTLTRCASPGLLTDITSLLATYHHF